MTHHTEPTPNTGMPLVGTDVQNTNISPSSTGTAEYLRQGAEGVTAATAALGTAAVVGAAVYGIAESSVTIEGLKSTPLATIGEAMYTAAEYSGPIGLAASAAAVAAFVATPSGRKIWSLASRGLVPNGGRSWRDRARRLTSGILLPTTGIVALNAAFTIQNEISDGPNRMVETIIEGVQEQAPAGSSITFTMQQGTRHFMESSTVSPADIRTAVTAVNNAQVPGVMQVVPFKADLTELPTRNNPHQAGLVISTQAPTGAASPILPEVKPGATCEQVDNKCILKPDEAVVDEGEGMEIGDRLNIRGQNVTVVGYNKEPQSLINRLVMFKGLSKEDVKTGYFGFATVAESDAAAANMLDQLNLNSLSMETDESLLRHNKDFWANNGTPPIMLIVADTLMLAAVAFAMERKNERERSKPQLATLRAIGATTGQIMNVQHGRIALRMAQCAIPAALVSKVLEGGINGMVPGFHGVTGPGMMTASTGIILGVQVLSGIRSPKQDVLADNMRDR